MKIKDIILVVLILMVVSMGGYLVYDKVLREDTVVDDENKDSNLNNNNANVDSNLINKDIDSYKNVDGTYGAVESIQVKSPDYLEEKWDFNVTLSIDGKVYIYDGNGRNVIGLINGLNNIIDIVQYYDAPGNSISDFYFLTGDGFVYRIKGSDLLENKYVATKLENVSNIDRIININYCPLENAGCAWDWVAVTNDEKFIRLSGGSV